MKFDDTIRIHLMRTYNAYNVKLGQKQKGYTPLSQNVVRLAHLLS